MEYLIVLLRWLGWHTLLALTLLWLALVFVVWQLAGVIRGLDVALLLSMALLGVLLGWLLAKSRLSLWQACAASSAISLIVVFIRVGQLGGPLSALLSALLSWSAQMSRGWLGADATLMVTTFAELLSASMTLLVRVRDWSFAWASGQPTLDPVASAMVWSLVVWALGAWAAWVVRRRAQPLEAFAPGATLLAVNLISSDAYPFALLALLSITLILMAWLGQRGREQRWQNSAVDFSDAIRLDLAFTLVPLLFVLVLFAALIPSLSVQDVFRFARGLAGSSSSGTSPLIGWLGAEPSAPSPSPFDPVRAGGLPRRHLLGSGPELSRQVVMLIKTDDAPSDQPPRYYWRSLSYERYIGRGWYADPIETITQKAGEPLADDDWPSHRRVQQDVQVVGESGGFLYAAGTLLTADHDFQIARRADGDLFGALIEAQSYHAESFVPVVGEAALRASGNHYPEWVRDRYLALPDDIPQRVLSLARDLTATEPTAYDRARAVERYIRAFPYTLELPEPPPNRDVVDYFLFDLKKGYCDYDATAMVVLARAAGLPARLVMGYASGAYDAANARYVVTAADAHSWVEIYFVGYGWIEFEPTGGRPPLERSNETPAIPAPNVKATSRIVGNMRDVWSTVMRVSLGALLLLGITRIAWLVGDDLRLRRMSPSAAVRAIYQRLYAHAAGLAVPIRAGDTPYQITTALASRVEALLARTRWQRALAPTAQQVHWLTELYMRAIFSRDGLDVTEVAQIVKIWRRVQRSLWLARLSQVQHMLVTFRSGK